MSDELLFHKFRLSGVIEKQQQDLIRELDQMSDDRLLNTDMAELQRYALGKYDLEMIELGEPRIDEARTKQSVNGWDGRTFETDAQRYTLEVPFTGERQLFYCQGSTFTTNPPRGSVSGNMVSMTIVERQPSADRLNAEFDRFLVSLQQHLDWLRSDVERWNASIAGVVDSQVQARRTRARQAGTVASGLKFALKPREDRAATFSAPVPVRKKIVPQLPRAETQSVG